jgi:hypothetical protein
MQVLRLVLKTSPDVIQQQIDTLLTEIAIPGVQEESQWPGTRHNAMRAIEMLEVLSSEVGPSQHSDQATAETVLQQVTHNTMALFDVLQAARVRRHDIPQWDEGFSRILALYNSCKLFCRIPFTLVCSSAFRPHSERYTLPRKLTE